jgi:hypothetical protein
MDQPKFNIIKVTKQHINEQIASTEYTEEDYILGEFDIEVVHVDGTKSYYGSYRTKSEAYEATKGMRKAKNLFRYGDQS